MNPLTQTKVLRALEDQQVERVGGTEMVRTNVRLIAATRRNLTELMEQETFRSDLYHRLNIYTIRLPPLRERASHRHSQFHLQLHGSVAEGVLRQTHCPVVVLRQSCQAYKTSVVAACGTHA